MLDCMVAADIKKAESDLFSVSRCKNSAPSVNILNLDVVPHDFDKVQEREVSKTAIAKAVKEGREVPGVEIIHGEHVRIR